MGPKKAAADKSKEKDHSDTEDIEPNRMERLEEELNNLREMLRESDKRIADTRLQSLTETKRLTDLLRQQDDIHRQESEEFAQKYDLKLREMSEEKDEVICDLQERLRIYKQMHDDVQQELARKVHFRDDDTVILSPNTSFSLGSNYGDSSSRHRNEDGTHVTIGMGTVNTEANVTPRRIVEQRRRTGSIFPSRNNSEEMPTGTLGMKYDVPLPRQLVYDGKMSWDSFIKPFLATAVACGWNETDRHFRLISSLRGEAAEYVFNQLSPEITESFPGLQRALESRFREKRTSSSYLNELENRKLLPKEKLLEYAADIKRLVHKGYPTADELTRETINVRYFLRGLSDQQLAVAVGMKDPKTIDDAREMVETYNSLRDDVGRSQRVRSVKFEDNPSKEQSSHNRQMKSVPKETSKWVTAEDIDRIIDMKLKEKRREGETPAPNGRHKQPEFRRDRGNVNKNHIECFHCHKLGHYANECPEKARNSTNERINKEN